MRRSILGLLTVIMVMVVTTLLSGGALAAINAVTPSTNEINQTNGWAHVVVDDVRVGEIDLDLVSTRGFASCFEYRIDGDTSTSTGANYNPAITDGLYPFRCVNNSTFDLNLVATEYVEIRMVFGAESDERFDWTRFDVLANPDVDSDGVLNEVDFCADTIADVPTVKLGTNRWIWNGDDWTTMKSKGKGPNFDVNMEDVYGCSCMQILDLYNQYTGAEMEGHYKFGCSKSVMEGAPMFIKDIMDGEYDGYVCEEFESLRVPSTNLAGVHTSTLTAGNMYKIDVSGTYRFADWGNYGIADAEWSYRSAPYTPDNVAGWVKGEGYFASECGLDLQVDGCVDWGDLSATNEYSMDYTGMGLPLHLFVYDNVYTDNSGELDVNICEMMPYEM